MKLFFSPVYKCIHNVPQASFKSKRYRVLLILGSGNIEENKRIKRKQERRKSRKTIIENKTRTYTVKKYYFTYLCILPFVTFTFSFCNLPFGIIYVE